MPKVKRRVKLIPPLKANGEKFKGSKTVTVDAVFDTDTRQTWVRNDIAKEMGIFGYFKEPDVYRDGKRGRLMKSIGAGPFSINVDGCGPTVMGDMAEEGNMEEEMIVGSRHMRRHGIDVVYDEDKGEYVLDVEECRKNAGKTYFVRLRSSRCF